MQRMLMALVAVTSLALAHQSRASWLPKQFDIYDEDGTYLDSGDAVEVTNSTTELLEFEISDYSTGALLFELEVKPGSTETQKIDRHVGVRDPSEIRPGGGINGVCTIDCFPAGTPVQTPGGLRAISELSPGDVVLTDEESGQGVVVEIRRSQSMALMRVELGDTVVLSSLGHPLLTVQGGWVAAGELTGSEKLLTAEGVAMPIRSIERVPFQAAEPVFNLVLEHGDRFLLGESGIQAAAASPVRN